MTLRQSQFVDSVPYIVATELGLLEGIDLVVHRTTGSEEQLQQLLTGDVDLVVTAIDNLFEWARLGADVRLLAQVERTTALSVYARPDIASFAALDGCRFGVDALHNGFALLARHLFADAGIDAQFIVVGGVRERLDALLAGHVDATLLGSPFDMLAEQAGTLALANVNELIPGLPGQGVIARAGAIGSDELGKYLKALQGAVEAADIMSDGGGVELLIRNGFGSTASAMWAERPRSLAVDPAGLALLTNIRERLGLLPPGVAIDSLSDPEPLRSVTN